MIYPNPNNGEFNISGSSETTLEVINQLGQVVKVVRLDEMNGYRIKVENMDAGIYFIGAAGNDVAAKQKVVVIK